MFVTPSFTTEEGASPRAEEGHEETPNDLQSLFKLAHRTTRSEGISLLLRDMASETAASRNSQEPLHPVPRHGDPCGHNRPEGPRRNIPTPVETRRQSPFQQSQRGVTQGLAEFGLAQRLCPPPALPVLFLRAHLSARQAVLVLHGVGCHKGHVAAPLQGWPNAALISDAHGYQLYRPGGRWLRPRWGHCTNARSLGLSLMLSLPWEPFPTARLVPAPLLRVQFEGFASTMTCQGPAPSPHSSQLRCLPGLNQDGVEHAHLTFLVLEFPCSLRRALAPVRPLTTPVPVPQH